MPSLDAQALMRAHAQSFYAASRWLSAPTRAQVELLYALARTADDLADEPHLGPFAARQRALLDLIADAQHADPQGSLAQRVAALLQAPDGLGQAALLHLLRSLQQDMLRQNPVTDLSGLMDYAYGVAGTVGLMLRPLLGAPREADAHAIAMGMAMQLTNVARDVASDAAQGRRYVPGDAAQPTAKDVLSVLAQAEALYAFGALGLKWIPQPNRRAVRAAMLLYRGIGRRLAAELVSSGQVPQQRTVLPKAQRLWLLARAGGLGRFNDWMAARRWRADAMRAERERALAALRAILGAHAGTRGLPASPAAL
jgi:15-cis-phytoene synthase